MAKFGRRALGWLAASRRDVGTAVGAAAIVLGLVLGSPKLWHATTTTTASSDVGTVAPGQTVPGTSTAPAGPTSASTTGKPGRTKHSTSTTPSPVTSSYHR